MANDNVQHGIDDNPNNDAEKGAALGGAGGAVTGALAGSIAGPVGTVIGAVVGGLAGAGASGLAVGAIDKIDNDNTISGVGSGATQDVGVTAHNAAANMGAGVHNAAANTGAAVHNVAANTGMAAHNAAANVDASLPGNRVPGVQTGGTTVTGAPDTRGITEKAADAVTGDRTDDKTGRVV